ncbi:hypothetical protein KIL84_023098 [Mauremys mutica]|uniref:Uncharacterized protein n=1 Tax=Mauremys mutica TaxID=74926 RepID=A0A9D4API0_9SAUR|nr:hypothetical protein KIL84_023098 [Mauremys mutica]
MSWMTLQERHLTAPSTLKHSQNGLYSYVWPSSNFSASCSSRKSLFLFNIQKMTTINLGLNHGDNHNILKQVLSYHHLQYSTTEQFKKQIQLSPKYTGQIQIHRSTIRYRSEQEK